MRDPWEEAAPPVWQSSRRRRSSPRAVALPSGRIAAPLRRARLPACRPHLSLPLLCLRRRLRASVSIRMRPLSTCPRIHRRWSRRRSSSAQRSRRHRNRRSSHRALLPPLLTRDRRRHRRSSGSTWASIRVLSTRRSHLSRRRLRTTRAAPQAFRRAQPRLKALRRPRPVPRRLPCSI